MTKGQMTQDQPKLLRKSLPRFRQLALERNEYPMAETAFAPEISELGDKLSKLTIVQAVQLKDYLKETYKIEPAAGGVAMAAGPAVVAAPAPEVKTEFTAQIDGFDPAKKLNVIKVMREITGLGLKE